MPLTESVNLVLKNQSVAATDTNIREVSLLLHGNGTNGSTTITDSSLSPKTVTAFGETQISTAQSAFPGGSSIFFDGSGDYLFTSSPDFAFGTGNFTIEFWLKTNTVTLEDGLFQLSTSATGFAQNYSASLQMQILSGKLCYQVYNSGDSIVNTNVTVNDNQWHHVAMVRSGSTVQVYVDGTSVSTVTRSNNITATNLVVGAFYSTNYTLLGYIDDFRITKAARYTANFTRPTAPFPDF